MPHFPLISDEQILEMPAYDNGEELVELEPTSYLFISDKHTEKHHSYTNPRFKWVRASIANKLETAAKKLPKNTCFLFEEGHRSLSVQAGIYNGYCEQLKKHHPDWPQDKIETEATKWVAKPIDNPPHTTGGAIDISLCDSNGKPFDMGSDSDDKPDDNNNSNYTFSMSVSSKALANRGILVNVLSSAGFVNYPAEWWHWSYGDKYWAFQSKRPHAIFETIES